MTPLRFVVRSLRLSTLACILGSTPLSLPAPEASAETPDPPAGEPTQGMRLGATTAHIPAPQIDAAGVLHALQGFLLVTEEDGWLLAGHALRWDQLGDELYASGEVVMILGPEGLDRGQWLDQQQDVGLARDSIAPDQESFDERDRRPEMRPGFSITGMRIHADRLGLRHIPHTRDEAGRLLDTDGEALGRLPFHGDAKDVEVWLSMSDGGLARVRAESLEISPDRMVLRNVHGDGGFGGVVSFRASALVINLRDLPSSRRSGFEAQAEDLIWWNPRIRLAGIPVIWLPVLYRDYRLNYPWTRYEWGRSSRLGYYVRAWIGSSLPPIRMGESEAGVDDEGEVIRRPAYWRSRLAGRYDYYHRVGEAYGMLYRWRHPLAGDGRALWYHMPDEKVYIPGESDVADQRAATVVDAEHRWSSGGSSLYARYISIPDADPIAIDERGDRVAPSERFRNDFMRNHLDNDPIARQGVALANTTPWLTSVVDTEWKTHPNLNQTERELGVQLIAPAISIAGPLHLDVSGWAERLRRETPTRQRSGGRWRQAHGDRYTYDLATEASQWWAGIGLDMRHGIRGLWERDGRRREWQRSGGDAGDPGSTINELSDVSVDSQHRWQPYSDAGISLRMTRSWGNEDVQYRHILTPRVGAEMVWNQYGVDEEDWVDLGFGGPRSSLPEERWLGTLNLNTSLFRNNRSIISADITSRWALRNEDREATIAGEDLRSDTPLVDIEWRLTLAPTATLQLASEGLYNFIADDFDRLALRARWLIHRRVELQWESSAIDLEERDWEHQARARIIGNRYTLAGETTMRPEGRDLDVIGASITRSFVDGEAGLTVEWEWDEDGGDLERRILFNFALFGMGAGGFR